MRITLLWPFGRYQPGDVVDVDQRIAEALMREHFARAAGEAPPPLRPKAPTLDELRQYAHRHECSLTDARDAMAADRASSTRSPIPNP